MELKLIRNIRTDKSTIGDLFVNGQWENFILEDVDRGLTDSMTLDEITKIKVYGKTAIPTGRYEVVISYSDHFKKKLPLLLNVPGYLGVRIHAGNVPRDTSGCLLCGLDFSTDTLYKSREAFYELFEKMEKAIHTEKVFITIS